MAERLVTKTRKGYDGDILTLCNPEESWSPRFKHEAIQDIETKLHNYFVEVEEEQINISVVIRGSKHLVTDKQQTLINNLEQLKDC
jgi:hypothetical protein